MGKRQGRVLVGTLRPSAVRQAVAGAFGTCAPKLEHRILIRGGKRLASTYTKTR